jgi:hypothetical protein
MSKSVALTDEKATDYPSGFAQLNYQVSYE